MGGVVDPREAGAADLRELCARLSHRGPDSEGIWRDPDTGVGLAHRRLAVVDLSPAGHQPMLSASGRYVLTFNGEIYNHRALREALQRAGAAPAWRGRSDTEVLLAGIEHWGLEAALQRCNGMFAFGLWDRQARVLSLARDRMGEKPLYYGWIEGRFAFASELKALLALRRTSPTMHAPAIAGFLDMGYVQGEASAVEGIHRLPPAGLMQLSLDDLRAPRSVTDIPDCPRYWHIAQAASDGLASPLEVGSSRVDLQACKLEYSIVSPK